MTFPIYFNTKKTVNLFGLSENFNFIKNLYLANKLPKVLMLSGKKGSGKSTLVNHLMFYLFDKDNYNLIGWQTLDIYQNLSITYLSSIKKNELLKKNIFKLPSAN